MVIQPATSGAMQAATQRCPPDVFRDRYTLADFEVTHTYGEGPTWAVCAARCKWSSAPVVLQTYAEVGNVSGSMGLALAAAHSLTHHPALLPLYAVFREPMGTGGPGDVTAAGGGGAEGGKVSTRYESRVVMVYPGGPAQHPLDSGPNVSPRSSTISVAAPSSSNKRSSATSPGSGGPPVSERGVVRNLLQPLFDMLAALTAPGLRPPYVCGLDVWLDSPEAPSPGQALFMVPLMCHRLAREAPAELHPTAAPYVAPYLRAHPATASQWQGQEEGAVRRWLAWSAAALVHTRLVGHPPPIKSPKPRKNRDRTSGGLPGTTSPSAPLASAQPSSGSLSPGVLQLPPLLAPPSSGGAGGAVPGASGGSGGGGAGQTGRNGTVMMPMTGALGMQRLSVAGLSPGRQPHEKQSSMYGSGLLTSVNVGMGGGTMSRNLRGSVGGNVNGNGQQLRSSGGGGGGGGGGAALDPMPLWLSDEAGDWFRRGLVPECTARPQLDELMRHGWVARHAVPRVRSMSNGIALRMAMNVLPRDLHPLLLDLVPLGLTRPGREEVDTMMAEIAATEAPSSAKPTLPWQVVEGPQEHAPHHQHHHTQPIPMATKPPTSIRPLSGCIEVYYPAGQQPQGAAGVVVSGGEGAEGESADPSGSEGGSTPLMQLESGLAAAVGAGPESTLLERYEIAEQQKADGTRVVEEVRVVSGKSDSAMARAAKALQAAMARRGAEVGQWQMANPRGTTFDDIARQTQEQKQMRPQPPSAKGQQHRGSNGYSGRSTTPPTQAPNSPTPADPPSPILAPVARPSLPSTVGPRRSSPPCAPPATRPGPNQPVSFGSSTHGRSVSPALARGGRPSTQQRLARGMGK